IARTGYRERERPGARLDQSAAVGRGRDSRDNGAADDECPGIDLDCARPGLDIDDLAGARNEAGGHLPGAATGAEGDVIGHHAETTFSVNFHHAAGADRLGPGEAVGVAEVEGSCAVLRKAGDASRDGTADGDIAR